MIESNLVYACPDSAALATHSFSNCRGRSCAPESASGTADSPKWLARREGAARFHGWLAVMVFRARGSLR